MTPSITKTTVVVEQQQPSHLIRQRISTKLNENPDQNNNNIFKDEFQIDDINYLTQNNLKEEEKRKEKDGTKEDYSNWKAEIR